MAYEITWKPSKHDRNFVSQLCLGIVVTKEYERVLIGKRDDIRYRLEGVEELDILHDEIRPFGTFLLDLDEDKERLWNKILINLKDARYILDKPSFERAFTTEDPKKYEKEAMEFLANKYETGNLIFRFVSLRIWYDYWNIRGTKRADDFKSFFEKAQSLVHLFNEPSVLLEERTVLTPEHSIFRYATALNYRDKQSVIYASLGEDNLECIIVDDSLLPVKKFYADKVRTMKKHVMKCELCGKFYIADSESFRYCSDECRKRARTRSLEQRREVGNTVEIDNLCVAANAYWNNRRRKIRKSPEWTDDEVQTYEKAMKKFQTEKREMRMKHKKGEITLSEFRHWLAEQSIEAEKTLVAIKVTQR